MAILGFVLECAAIAALLSCAASVIVVVAAVLLRPILLRRNPSLRADLAFLAGAFPAIVAVAGTLAAAAPSIGSALGLADDHCLQHSHHLHVCIIHRVALRPDLAALGAAALAMWLLRASLLIWHASQTRRDALALERLGVAATARFPVITVPGAPRLCHAVGALRRRILISDSLATELGPVRLRCVLAHETAHLSRRDPLANMIMSVAGLFVLPPLAGMLQRAYRAAAEQACDDDAARVVGDGTLVADALVSVTSVLRDGWKPNAATAALGFGQHPLETRVRRLLAGVEREPRSACALPSAFSLVLVAFLVALNQANYLHHAVETALHQLF